MGAFSAEALNLLQIFILAANRATGSSHTLDKARWETFIIYCYRNNEYDIQTLGDILIQNGFNDEITTELQVEFENGISLLRHFQPL